MAIPTRTLESLGSVPRIPLVAVNDGTSADPVFHLTHGGQIAAIGINFDAMLDANGKADLATFLADLAVTTSKIAAGAVTPPKNASTVRYVARSRIFNIDNGAAATIDDVVFKPSAACTIRRAQIVYVTETAGTVAGANVKLGTTIGGGEIVAATAYANGAVIGAATAMTLVSGAVAADQAVHCRHTGIAATAAGEAYVEVEYTID